MTVKKESPPMICRRKKQTYLVKEALGHVLGHHRGLLGLAKLCRLVGVCVCVARVSNG